MKVLRNNNILMLTFDTLKKQACLLLDFATMHPGTGFQLWNYFIAFFLEY